MDAFGHKPSITFFCFAKSEVEPDKCRIIIGTYKDDFPRSNMIWEQILALQE